jgi:hypothetical protein
MKRILWAVLGSVGLLVLLLAGLLAWSFARDQWNFKHAKNQCERDCIQDSGGLEGCRAACDDIRKATGKEPVYGPPR